MLNRRRFLLRALQGSSLVALGSVVPQFLVQTSRAAEAGKDTILVVIEMTGGNDGLNTVIPYADDLYQKNRPTLRFTKEQVLKVDDEVGLHPGFAPMQPMLQQGQVAVVQGVGYPNPDRSHFESMDVWQSADPTRKTTSGWLARSATDLQGQGGGVPALQIGPEKLPLALRGAPTGVASINNTQPFKIKLSEGKPAEKKARQALLTDLAKAPEPEADSLLQFVQRRQLETYTTVERLEEVLKNIAPDGRFPGITLAQKLQLVAQLIEKGFGTRLFYVAIDGFDTHSNQAPEHQRLLGELAASIATLFQTLQQTGHDKRVLVMTFSEFGRRVLENGSKGTDHGAGSCLLVAGPGVQAGAVGKHPSLSDLDAGDLKYHTDFRQVYATLLDDWLHCDSKAVLNGAFEHIKLLKAKG
jgi:uncharacterized protein (DUF1501 family)